MNGQKPDTAGKTPFVAGKAYGNLREYGKVTKK